jgi:dTDP-4-amino-4,6-dideoxygalactose transaminase
MGGTYRALCVLERLLERGERVVAFIGQEGSNERDFCPEILEICDRSSIPARSARKMGEEIVRWLEDRIRPDLAIAVGVTSEIPLAIGGNCRLGLLEAIDCLQSDSCPGIALKQRGQVVSSRVLPRSEEDGTAGDFYLRMVDELLELLGDYLDQLGPSRTAPEISIPFAQFPAGIDPCQIASRPEPGPETDALENELAEYLGAHRTVALRSHREALELLSRSLQLADNDEVICPVIVSVDALEAIRSTGARPVFVDVEPGRLTLDPRNIEAAISPRTRAILIAHPFGQPAALAQLYDIAEAAGLEVFEDGGASLGARYGDSRLGRSPCTTVFRMPIGGCDSPTHAALVTLPETLAAEFAEDAGGLRLGDSAAAAARQLLRDLDEWIAARQRNASTYSAALGRYDAFDIPPTPEDALPTYASYVLRVTRYSRTTADDLEKLLAENGIEVRRLAPPLRERDLARLGVAENAITSAVLLPVDRHLRETQLDHVLDALFSYAIG